MKEKTVVEKKRNSPPRGAGGAKKARRYTPDEKLKAVRLRLEEGFSVQDVCGEMGMAVSCLHNWIHRYQKFGEAGLQKTESSKRAPKLPAPITEKIVELKQQNPGFGIKRISQLLRRCFFLPASPETVRRHLHEAELMPPSKPPKQRNITRPRFFERATPNQMWQTDIFTFRLGGRYAYLIAFMDDYSRFIVGADLFRSPTAIQNTAGGGAATVGGGSANVASGDAATVPGGVLNVAGGDYSFAAGRRAKALHQGAFVWADSQGADFTSTANDQFLIRAQGGVGVGTASPQAQFNVNGTARIEATPTSYNEGLTLNLPTDMASGSGYGGIHFHSTARGGAYGSGTIKWGIFYNYAPEVGVGGNGFSFVQNNTNTRLFISTNGNVGIGTLNPTNKLMVVNARCDGSSWINASDRNLKQDFASIDAQAVLARVAALPVTTWSYKTQPEQKHLGPVAQDFHAAFGLGEDDTSISTVDESGVALAAIQGLNQKLNDKDVEIQDLKRSVADLKKLVQSLAERK